MWIGEQEGAKLWLGVLTELQAHRAKDILIAAVDGLTGFPEAIESLYPKTRIQLCIVHMVRASMKYVPIVARAPGERDPVLQLLGADPEGDPHDERDRVDQRAVAEGDAQARRVTDRRLRPEGAVPGSAASLPALDHADPGLAGGPELLLDPGSGWAGLGAAQNRLESVIRMNANLAENLSAANSRIRDADVAAEMAALTSARILQQAAVAVLAQAQRQPNLVLFLLDASTRRR